MNRGKHVVERSRIVLWSVVKAVETRPFRVRHDLKSRTTCRSATKTATVSRKAKNQVGHYLNVRFIFSPALNCPKTNSACRLPRCSLLTLLKAAGRRHCFLERFRLPPAYFSRDTDMTAEPGSDTLLPTRQSLLWRLRDWQDQTSWRDFFDTYWRLIYNVARKSGFTDAEAQDVVQNTFIYLSRRMPNFQYDPKRGSFKSWLRVVTRSRINVYRRTEKAEEKFRREQLLRGESGEADGVEELPDPAADALDEVWQREWEENLLSAAFRRIRSRVSSQQLLIFRLATLGDLPLTQVAKKLGVSLAQVYLARHRVGKLFKAEVQRLRQETE